MNISTKFQLFLIYFCKFSVSVAMATNQIQWFGQNSYDWQRTTQGTFL